MSIEAMKQALELAKKLDRDLSVETWELAKVMGQLEQAIAEAEQDEPVAFITNHRQRMNVQIKPEAFVYMPTTTDWKIPLYTHPQPKAEQDKPVSGFFSRDAMKEHSDFHPQQRKPLTDEQKKSIARRAFKDICKDYPVQDRIILVINDIEAAHGIKE